MKSAVREATSDRSSHPGRPDLVRLALTLAGATELEHVLARSLGWLATALPEAPSALLYRLESGRYRAAADARVGHDDLRRLARHACGAETWLSLGNPAPNGAYLGEPSWVAVRGQDVIAEEASLVLAWWAAGPDRGLDPQQRDELDTAARLVASAADSARVFEYLVEQSARDPLTGLLNRKGILEVFQREAARVARCGGHLAVIFLDIDHFKQINDRFGHAVGDDVLAHVADELSRDLRASDAVGRLGGDEFLIVLPDTDLRAARRIGRRLRQRGEQQGVGTRAGQLPVRLSYGASSSDEQPAPLTMIEVADQRMLAQKRRRHRERTQPPRLTLPAILVGAGKIR